MGLEFWDDFETGDFSKWTADPLGWGFTIVGSPVHGGSNAAQSIHGVSVGALWHTLTDTPTTKYIIDFWLYLKGDSIPAGVGSDVFIRVYNASELLDIQVHVVSGQVANKYSLRLYDNGIGGNNDYGSTGLELNTWYHLRLEVEVLNATATHSLYLADVLECSIADDTTTYNVTKFSFDPVTSGAPYNMRGIIDDVYCYTDILCNDVAIINSGGSLCLDVIDWKEVQICKVAVRNVPLRTTGSFVDEGTYTLKNRKLSITIRLSEANKTILRAIFDANVIVTITAGDWTYTGWLREKPLRWEYSKTSGGIVRNWVADLEFDIETFSYSP